MRLFKAIASALLGLTLSISLPACGHRPPAAEPPLAVAPAPEIFERVIAAEKPPAELLACPERPAGFPPGLDAQIPPDARAALIRLALAYDRAVRQLERLIAWQEPGKCAPAEGPAHE